MPAFSSAASAIEIVQILLVVLGLGLIGAWYFAPRLVPLRTGPAPLPRWDASLSDTLLVAWAAVASVFLGSLLAGSISRQFGLTTSQGWTSVLSVLGFQGTLVVVVGLFAFFKQSVGHPLPACGQRPAAPVGDRLLLGAAVFCAALPLVIGTSFLAQEIMNRLGLPIELQELADIFAATDDPALLLGLTLMGVVVAPLGEEILFRAGLFRICGRLMPHWAAVVVSSLAFATVHGSTVHFVPLAILGAVFAIGYERSGSLLVPVVAHGLFNLNSILGLLAGLGGTS